MMAEKYLVISSRTQDDSCQWATVPHMSVCGREEGTVMHNINNKNKHIILGY